MNKDVKLELSFHFFRDDMGILRYRCDELGDINAYATIQLANKIGEKIMEDVEK